MNKVKDAAAKKFQEISELRGHPQDLCLRLFIAPGGWAGPQVAVVLDEHIGKGDIVVEDNGVKVVYTRSLHELVKNTHVDYVNTFFSKGFRAY